MTIPTRTNRAGRPRRGYTLIEMVVVISLIATLLGLGSMVTYRLVRADRAGRAALDDQAAAARLAEQFRRDAHAAVAVAFEPGQGDTPAALAFAMPDGDRVTYRVRDGLLTVTRDNPGTPVERDADAASRASSFRSNRFGSPGLGTLDEGGSTLAVLTLGDPERASTRVLRVEALVGFDHRFALDGGDR